MTGDVVYDTNYVPFGPDQDEKASEGSTYTGKHRDPTGLYYLGARYYDPETGKFITETLLKEGLSTPTPSSKPVAKRARVFVSLKRLCTPRKISVQSVSLLV